MGNTSSAPKLVGSKRIGIHRSTSFAKNSTNPSGNIFDQETVFPISKVRKIVEKPDNLLKSANNNPNKVGRLYLCKKDNGLIHSINFKSTYHFSLVLDIGGHSDEHTLRGALMHIYFSSDKRIIYSQRPIEYIKLSYNSVEDAGTLVYPYDNIERLQTDYPEYIEMDMLSDKNHLWYYYILIQMDNWLKEFIEGHGSVFSIHCNCQSFAKYLCAKLSGVQFPCPSIFGERSIDKVVYTSYSVIETSFLKKPK
ncbi:hypothetical protein CYY_002936 [Polysphondylium violaceum]|uniref:Uncharacterized protein n=1 Tax=Polysphondylium violaceum TaxID=133409 RepID=A0A8J4PZB9_9MYCE|nr:hypothetical protein CYY_002936 [Polysphondylium violaceum]